MIYELQFIFHTIFLMATWLIINVIGNSTLKCTKFILLVLQASLISLCKCDHDQVTFSWKYELRRRKQAIDCQDRSMLDNFMTVYILPRWGNLGVTKFHFIFTYFVHDIFKRKACIVGYKVSLFIRKSCF